MAIYSSADPSFPLSYFYETTGKVKLPAWHQVRPPLAKGTAAILKIWRRIQPPKRLIDGSILFDVKEEDESSERVEVFVCQTTLIAPSHQKRRGSLFVANPRMLDG